MPETVVDLAAAIIRLRGGDALRGIARMLAVKLAQHAGEALLLGPRRRILRQLRIDKIVEAGELLEPVLPAKFVVSRDAALAVADDIKCQDVDLAARALQAWHAQILEKERVVLQRQSAEPLTTHGESPVGQTVLMHGPGRLAARGFHDRNLVPDKVWISMQFSELDEIRHHRVQTIDRDELFGKIERRAKMVDAAVDVRFITSQRENAGARREDRIPLAVFVGVLRFAQIVNYSFKRARHDRMLGEQAAPVGVHGEIKRFV